MIIIKEYVFSKYTLKYLEVKEHPVYNLLINISGENYKYVIYI